MRDFVVAFTPCRHSLGVMLAPSWDAQVNFFSFGGIFFFGVFFCLASFEFCLFAFGVIFCLGFVSEVLWRVGCFWWF
jgi:hypothetical protein